jgi:hypothetical protein
VGISPLSAGNSHRSGGFVVDVQNVRKYFLPDSGISKMGTYKIQSERARIPAKFMLKLTVIPENHPIGVKRFKNSGGRKISQRFHGVFLFLRRPIYFLPQVIFFDFIQTAYQQAAAIVIENGIDRGYSCLVLDLPGEGPDGREKRRVSR